ncbi:hypothetical protein GPECTOR_99g793 [Gonium pectorale]|uniref:Cyclic nucleotide-binding domain-containing protein n=1 Tax=Gonium pectorale TaxID=33097 RepID=A0A150G002_GONPE|nr:hypothetical protein GPECTOR_99g793 [Gonium pectorale]|eukprot:KXZ43158.1 hypothetical protein GPECTOR_99g793 [Gonium pectorale]
MGGLEAFTKLPTDMLRRLAAECCTARLPSGRVLIEEDAPGDCMFVMLAGRATVRARPLAKKRPGVLGLGRGVHPRAHHGHALRHRRPTTGDGGEIGGGGCGARSGGRSASFATVLTVHGGRHGTTGGNAGGAGSDDESHEDHEVACRPGTASKALIKDSPFWIARFMEDTLKRLQPEGSIGASGFSPRAGMAAKGNRPITPLVAVAAARWRHAAALRHSRELSRTGGTEDGGGGAGAAVEDGGGNGEGMEALLGRAAARALQRAIAEKHDRHGAMEDGEGAAANVQQISRPATTNADGTPNPVAGAAAESALIGCAPWHQGSRASLHSAAGTVAIAAPAAATAAAAPGVSAPIPALEDPAKRLLSQIGSRDPTHVSRALLSELVQRADVGVVLYEVAKKLVRRGGGPRHITAGASRRISRALQQQIRAGPDRLPATLQGQKLQARNTGLAALPGLGGLAPVGDSLGLPSGAASEAHSGQAMSFRRRSSSGRPRVSMCGSHATRPASALTSGTSLLADLEGAADDEACTEYDWYGSDLYSMLSCRIGTATSQVTPRRRDALDMLEPALLPVADPEEAEPLFGPVVRLIRPGQSFGELALLQRDSRRTATVITGSPAADADGAVGDDAERVRAFHQALKDSTDSRALGIATRPSTGLAVGANGGGGAVGDTVEVLVISRHTYNATVRAAQVAQLQSLLGFLASLQPFSQLDDAQRAAVAVFCRQREVAAGAVLAVQGEPANTLWMVQEGEVVLLDSSAIVTDALVTPPAGPMAGLARGPTVARGTLRAVNGPSGVRVLLRQLSAPEADASSSRTVARLPPAALGNRKEPAAHRRVMFDSGTADHSAVAEAASGAADGPLRHVPPGVLRGLGGTLTSMGAGGLFGEGLLANQQPLDEDGGRPRTASIAQPPYPATAIARRPTRLLTISSSDLARFADFVAAPLTAVAEARRAFFALRSASLNAAAEAVSARVAGVRRVLHDLQDVLESGVPLDQDSRLAAELREETAAAAAAAATDALSAPPTEAPPALSAASGGIELETLMLRQPLIYAVPQGLGSSMGAFAGSGSTATASRASSGRSLLSTIAEESERMAGGGLRDEASVRVPPMVVSTAGEVERMQRQLEELRELVAQQTDAGEAPAPLPPIDSRAPVSRATSGRSSASGASGRGPAVASNASQKARLRSASSDGSRTLRPTGGAGIDSTGSISRAAANDSFKVYSDSGATSPDLNGLPLEPGAALLYELPMLGLGRPQAAATVRRTISNVSDGLVLLPGFGISSFGASSSSSSAAAAVAVESGSCDKKDSELGASLECEADGAAEGGRAAAAA